MLESKQQTPYNTFCSHFQRFVKSNNFEQKKEALRLYCVALTKQKQDQSFFQHFIQNKVIITMLSVLRENNYDPILITAVFLSMQILLKSFRKQTDLTYFILLLMRSGFIQQEYIFHDQQDAAYYDNFLKLLTRQIKFENYLTIFYNCNQPHFPLMISLLKFHNCPNLIIHTSAKLSILYLSSMPMLQSYIQEFPFVMFYPLHVTNIYNALKSMVQNNSSADALQQSLKYMEDFIQEKSNTSVQMYSNCFIALIGKYIYQQVLNNKFKILQIMLKHVLRTNLPPQIKKDLMRIMQGNISLDFKRQMEDKITLMNDKYSILYYTEQIKRHSKIIFRKRKNSISVNQQHDQSTNQYLQSQDLSLSSLSSTLKFCKSYIPYAKQNILSSQLSLLSNLIGFSVTLDNMIAPKALLPSSIQIQNPFPRSILNTKNEHFVFLYLRCLNTLYPVTSLPSDAIIGLLVNCVSLSLIRQFYILTCHSPITKTIFVNKAFECMLNSLADFVVSHSWQLLLQRSIIQMDVKSQAFDMDIIREIDCDIVLFAALRNALEGREEIGFEEKYQQQYQSLREYKVKCKLIRDTLDNQNNRSNRSNKVLECYLVMQGINLKLENDKDQQIVSNINLNRVSVFETAKILILQIKTEYIYGYQQRKFEIYQNQYKLEFLKEEQTIAVLQEIYKRKKVSLELYLALKNAKFSFK